MAVGFIFDFENCTECERCMIACSLAKTGKVLLAESRIRISRSWPKLPVISVCRFDSCENQPCIDVCPVSAISNEDGIVRIDKDVCIGCEACVSACPYGAIGMKDDIAFKCDFCGGDPACVKECVTGALKKGDDE